MADHRLLCCRSPSIAATRADSDSWRSPAISFSALQKSSSRLILVLWPAMRMERLTTGDFISAPPNPPLGTAALKQKPAPELKMFHAIMLVTREVVCGGGNGRRGTRVARRGPRAPMSLGRSRPPRSASRRRLIVGLSFRNLSGPVPKSSHGIGTLARICAAHRATSLVIRGRSARAPIIGRIITPRIIIPGLVATMVRRATCLLRPLLRSSIGRSLFCTGLGDQCLGRGRG
jgi:hypothetical protein